MTDRAFFALMEVNECTIVAVGPFSTHQQASDTGDAWEADRGVGTYRGAVEHLDPDTFLQRYAQRKERQTRSVNLTFDGETRTVVGDVIHPGGDAEALYLPYVFTARTGGGRKTHRADLMLWRATEDHRGLAVTDETGARWQLPGVCHVMNRPARIVGWLDTTPATSAHPTTRWSNAEHAARPR